MTTTDEAEDHWSHCGLDDDEIATHTALREDIPEHLQKSLWSWVESAFTVKSTSFQSAHIDTELVRTCERVLQIPIGWPNPAGVVTVLKVALQNRPIRDTWRVVNWLLGFGHAHGGTLKTYLLQAGSAYTVEAANEGKCYLIKRVPDGVQDAANAAFAQPNAGKRLTQAWKAAFGVDPDPVKAYSLAVKSVEDASNPVICPSDSSATLVKVIGQVNTGTWKLPHLREDPNVTTHDVLVGMMKTLWVGQHDRHGGPSSVGVPAVSPEEAESAVLLAVSLVGWFETGKVQH
jgi:hypothetical protein